MTDEQMLLIKWRTLSNEKQLEVLEYINSLSTSNDQPISSYQPKTELGKKLWQIRSDAIAEGKIKLLDWEGIEKEIATRRGETE